MKIPKLMLITNGQLDSSHQMVECLRSAYAWGLPAIQLREKQLDCNKLFHLAEHLNASAMEYAGFLSINERVDIALSVGAGGVHLPSNGRSPGIVKKLNPKLVVGVSVHDYAQAMQAEEAGADYVLVGAVFKPLSKVVAFPLVGLAQLQGIAEKLTIPVIAVGGICPQNVKFCLAHGAYGVAAVGSFFQSTDLRRTIEEFLQELEK